eukprot:302599-Amphidinium_carterae.1
MSDLEECYAAGCASRSFQTSVVGYYWNRTASVSIVRFFTEADAHSSSTVRHPFLWVGNTCGSRHEGT